MDLDKLLASLNDSGMTKQASAPAQEEIKPDLAKEIAEVLEKKASEDLTKQAFEQGEQAAKELLSQLQGNEMNKQAQLAGKDLATAIMTKLAEELGLGQGTPSAETSPPVNQIQAENAVMEAQSAAKVAPTPDGTVNQILEQLVARSQGAGAGVDNLANDEVGGGAEGASATSQASEEVEKAAAVSTLVDSGYDFDTAIALVKEAELAIAQDEANIEKMAAINDLMSQGLDFDSAVAAVSASEQEWTKQAALENLMAQGVDFDSAVELVKQAGIGELAGKAVDAAKRFGRDAGQYATEAKYHAGKAFGKEAPKAGRMAHMGVLAKNPVVQAGAATTAGAAGLAALAARGNEKRAAMEALLADGVDFDTAIALVKQASLEVYGE